jgi:hypothetical protein
MSLQIHKTVKCTDILRYYDCSLAQLGTTTWCHNPDDNNLNVRCSANLKLSDIPSDMCDNAVLEGEEGNYNANVVDEI